MTQQEVGAVKEYPGGFTLLRIHSGGYALNFYKTRGEPGTRVERTQPAGAGWAVATAVVRTCRL